MLSPDQWLAITRALIECAVYDAPYDGAVRPSVEFSRAVYSFILFGG